jgi:hypothetical protein
LVTPEQPQNRPRYDGGKQTDAVISDLVGLYVLVKRHNLVVFTSVASMLLLHCGGRVLLLSAYRIAGGDALRFGVGLSSLRFVLQVIVLPRVGFT